MFLDTSVLMEFPAKRLRIYNLSITPFVAVYGEGETESSG